MAGATFPEQIFMESPIGPLPSYMISFGWRLEMVKVGKIEKLKNRGLIKNPYIN